jgi:Domain of unknown function (DUF4124)
MKIKQKVIQIAVLLSLALALPSLSQAQFYKWVDAEGNVHYSDKKPKDQSEIKSIKINTGKGSSPSTPVENNTPAAEAALQQKADALQSKKPKEEYAKQCASIEENMRKLAENSRVRINDNGEMRYLTPEELTAKKDQYQKMYDDFCK